MNTTSSLPSDPELVRLVDELAEPEDLPADAPAPCADAAHEDELYGVPPALAWLSDCAYAAAAELAAAARIGRRLARALDAFAAELEPHVEIVIACVPEADAS